MQFINCNFVSCRKFDFDCVSCPFYVPDGVSDVPDPIHPVLGIPISQVDTK